MILDVLEDLFPFFFLLLGEAWTEREGLVAISLLGQASGRHASGTGAERVTRLISLVTQLISSGVQNKILQEIPLWSLSGRLPFNTSFSPTSGGERERLVLDIISASSS